MGGFVNERFPSYLPQHSPTFSMIWALMLHDYAFWRNDPAFVKARAIGLRSMLEQFEPYLNQSGLLQDLPGWPFMDWVAAVVGRQRPRRRQRAFPPSTTCSTSMRSRNRSRWRRALGEPLLAQRLREKAAHTAAAVRAQFWDESRGLMSDNLAHDQFSEHAQCLALLTDTFSGAQAQRCFQQLLAVPDLKRTTIYFSFYLLEDLAEIRPAAI